METSWDFSRRTGTALWDWQFLALPHILVIPQELHFSWDSQSLSDSPRWQSKKIQHGNTSREKCCFSFELRFQGTEQLWISPELFTVRIVINCDNTTLSWSLHIFICPAGREEVNIFQVICSSQSRGLLKGDTACILHMPALVQELLWWYVSPHLCTILQDSNSMLGHPLSLLNYKTKLSKQLVSNKAESTPQQSAGALLLPSKGTEKSQRSRKKNKNEREK